MGTLSKLLVGVVFTPIALLVMGIGGCEATKAYYDWQLKEMCAQDGGIKIYEHIKVSREAAASMGRVGGHLSIAVEAVAPVSDIAFLRVRSQPLRDGYISMKRYEHAVVRRVDGKVVGLMVRYERAGGDFPFTVSSPTIYSCPDWEQFYEQVATIFTLETSK